MNDSISYEDSLVFARRSRSIMKFMAALQKAQEEFDPVIRDIVNPHLRSKYANLAGVIEATEKALRANKLVMTQPAIYRDEKAGCLTVLFHTESGEYLSEELLIPLERTGGQGVGTAISYARRYSRLAMLGIAAEDDDGNQSSNIQPKGSTTPPAQPKVSHEVFTESPSRPLSGQPNKSSGPVKAVIPALAAPQGDPAGGLDPTPPPGTKSAPEPSPSVSELAGFKDRATKISRGLVEAGLTVDASKKLHGYLLASTGTKDLKEIPTRDWKRILTDLETLLKSSPKTAVNIVQGEAK